MNLDPVQSCLAAVPILVSFLHQRFMTGKDEETKSLG